MSPAKKAAKEKKKSANPKPKPGPKPKPTAKASKKTSPLALSKGDAPPKDVTRDLFLVWRAPRIGMANPQRLTNAAWTWLARHKEMNAYVANAHFAGPSSMAVGPCFCANRFGQSITDLPDGRVFAIAGEHEDYYDPDFFIYNDVIVTDAAGRVEIFGYPREVFPPTDFHTATLVGNRIIVIGCLGYPSQRDPGTTPVFAVDTTTLAITRLTTTGMLPGRIFNHEAELAADARTIVIRKGERAMLVHGAEKICDNHDDWSLDLETLTWRRLTERRWPVWELARADGERNHLWEIEGMSWHADGKTPFDRAQFAAHRKALGRVPDLDVFATRFSPPIAHTKVEDAEARHDTTTIEAAGMLVRYRQESRCVRITVCGRLPEETVATLVDDARRKLEVLEQFAYEARLVPAF